MSRSISWGGILSDSCEDGAVIKLLTVGLNLAADTVVHRYVSVSLSVCLSVCLFGRGVESGSWYRYESVCLSVCLSALVLQWARNNAGICWQRTRLKLRKKFFYRIKRKRNNEWLSPSTRNVFIRLWNRGHVDGTWWQHFLIPLPLYHP